MHRSIVACSLALSCFVAACSGSEDGSTTPSTDDAASTGDTASTSETSPTDTGTGEDDTGAEPTDSGILDDTGAAPTFTQVFALFTARCGSCHRGGSPAGGLTLANKAGAYADLVGVKAEGSACKPGGKTRVVAGDPAASLLVEKLKASPSCGNRMPQGGKAFDATELGTVTAWITAGAKND